MTLSRKNSGLLLRIPFLLIILGIVAFLFMRSDSSFCDYITTLPFFEQITPVIRYFFEDVSEELNKYYNSTIILDLSKSFIIVIIHSLTARVLYKFSDIGNLLTLTTDTYIREKELKSPLYFFNHILIQIIAGLISIMVSKLIFNDIIIDNFIVYVNSFKLQIVLEIMILIISIIIYVIFMKLVLRESYDYAISIAIVDLVITTFLTYIPTLIAIGVFYGIYVKASVGTITLLIIVYVVSVILAEIISKTLNKFIIGMNSYAKRFNRSPFTTNYRFDLNAFLALFCLYILLFSPVNLMIGEVQDDTYNFIIWFFQNKMPFIRCLIGNTTLTEGIIANFEGFLPDIFNLFILSFLMSFSVKIFRVPNVFKNLFSSRNGIGAFFSIVAFFYISVFCISIPACVFVITYILCLMNPAITIYLVIAIIVTLALLFILLSTARSYIVQSAAMTIILMIILEIVSCFPVTQSGIEETSLMCSLMCLGLFSLMGVVNDFK